jgi:hypothetical protein
VATKFALLIGRRGAMLTIASVVTALLGAKTGHTCNVAGFWDGPH